MEIMLALPHCWVTGPGIRFSLQHKHHILDLKKGEGVLSETERERQKDKSVEVSLRKGGV